MRLVNLYLLLLLSILPRAAGAQAPAPPETPQSAAAAAPKAIGKIAAGQIKAHVEYLASDELQGRLTGTPGQRKAAEYIAKQFESLGLEPFGDPGGEGERGWLHHYDITTTHVAEHSGLFKGEERTHSAGAWVMPSSYRSGERELDISGHLYYLGAPARNQRDFTIPSGAIPVVLLDQDTSRDEAMNVNTAFMLGMQQVFGRIRSVAAAARRAQAPGIIVLTRAYNIPFQCSMTMLGLMPGQPAVTLGSGGGMADFAARATAPEVPVLVLAGADATRVLAALGLDVEAAFGGEAGNATSADAFRFRFQVEPKADRATNVVAILRGSDPGLSQEAIVYSAHMDHVGLAAGGGVFNGADDNASGSASLIEIARAYAALPQEERPKRSVIFLSVSGEELGLWGSEAWAADEVWPADKLIANINIDMIGRSTRKVPSTAISITPTHKHRAYSSLAREASFLGEAFDLSMANGDRFYQRSDHYNFAKRGVPVVFFCDDEHADYHMPTDTPDKIEYEKVERVARLAFLLGYRTIGRAERPVVLGSRDDWGRPGDS